MVTALVTKLRAGQRRADLADRVGGSTYVFDLWRDHPMIDEATGYLRHARAQAGELRRRIAEYNRSNVPPRGAAGVRVVAYVGQTVQEDSVDDEG
jgi:hypothetical protein